MPDVANEHAFARPTVSVVVTKNCDSCLMDNGNHVTMIKTVNVDAVMYGVADDHAYARSAVYMWW